MSPTNWDICPRCLLRARKIKFDALREAKAAYGSASQEDYLELLRAAESMDPEAMDCMLRESYELGIDDDGAFCVHYRCECTKCGLRHSFEHREKVKIDD